MHLHEVKFLNILNIFVFFVVVISPWVMVWAFICKNLNSIYPRKLCAKFGPRSFKKRIFKYFYLHAKWNDLIALGDCLFGIFVPEKFTIVFIKVRTANHLLSVETGSCCATPNYIIECNVHLKNNRSYCTSCY